MVVTSKLHPVMEEIGQVCSRFTHKISGRSCIPSMWHTCLQNQHRSTTFCGSVDDDLVIAIASIGRKRSRKDSSFSDKKVERSLVTETIAVNSTKEITSIVSGINTDKKDDITGYKSSLDEPEAKRKFTTNHPELFSQFAFVPRKNNTDAEVIKNSIDDTIISENLGATDNKESGNSDDVTADSIDVTGADDIITESVCPNDTIGSVITTEDDESLDKDTISEGSVKTRYGTDIGGVLEECEDNVLEPMDTDEDTIIKDDYTLVDEHQKVITDVSDLEKDIIEHEEVPPYGYTSFQPDEYDEAYSPQTPSTDKGDTSTTTNTTSTTQVNEIISKEYQLKDKNENCSGEETNATEMNTNVVEENDELHTMEDSAVKLLNDLSSDPCLDNSINDGDDDRLPDKNTQSSDVSEEVLSDSGSSQQNGDTYNDSGDDAANSHQDYGAPLPFMFQSLTPIIPPGESKVLDKPDENDSKNEALLMLLKQPSERKQNNSHKINTVCSTGNDSGSVDQTDITLDRDSTSTLNDSNTDEDKNMDQRSTLTQKTDTVATEPLPVYNPHINVIRADKNDTNRLMSVMASRGFDQLPMSLILKSDTFSVHGSHIFMDDDGDDLDFTTKI